MIRVIVGPPAAGKSTLVAQCAAPGDIRVDFDALAATLTGDPDHDQAGEVRALVKSVRNAAINYALTHQLDRDVWIIHTDPSPDLIAIYRDAGAVFHVVDPGERVVLERCAAGRPWAMQQAARQWYKFPPEVDATPPPAPAVAQSRRW